MKLKKLLAAVTAAALAVSTMAVTNFTASAAALTTVPEGTREVLAAAEVDYAPTDAWDNGPWGQITGVQEEWMTDENVYVEAKFSALGGANTDDGEAPFDDVKGWATILKWYNNNTIEGTDAPDTTQNFEVEFKACEGGTADECLAYAPISDFKRVSWGGICGNLQSGNIKGFTLESLSIVKFTASSEDDDLPKNVWFKNEYGSDAYICTNGNAPEEALFVDVEALLDDGKTLADVSKITAIYAVSSLFDAEQGVSGCFGVVHDVGGTNDWYDDIYSEWEWSASDSTAEEGKDCIVNCANGLLDTDECQFQIDTMKADNVLVVGFQIDYKDEGGDEPPVDDKSVTGSETLTGSNWWAEKSLTVAELLGDLDKTKTTITFTSDDDIIVGYKSKTVVDESADDPNWKQNTPAKSVVISSSDIDFDNYMLKVCVSRNDDKEVTINWIAKEGSAPVEPEKPAESTSKVLWEGTQATDNWSGSVSSIAASEFANVKAGDKIAVTYTVPADGDGHQLSLKYQGTDWPGLPGFVAGDGGEWAAYDVSADDTYEYTLTDADVTALKEYSIAVGGKYIVITKIELITTGGTVTPPPSGGDDDNNGDNKDPETPAVTYVPTVNTMVTPFGYTPATDEEIANTVSSTAEGDTANVNLTSGTRVEKAVFDSIAGKDINVEFKLKGGVKWIINGKNVEKAKKVDLGVRLRSKNIPAEKISAVAGENKTVQFSLRHNGDLGFTGALIIPFSSSYNGKFANLYYYNKAKDDLEFIGSSKISAGQASFVFTHASDYVVVIDDEAYGEDVSSAAGVYETSEETTAPYAAVAVIAVLGAAAVVIRKRLAK